MTTPIRPNRSRYSPFPIPYSLPLRSREGFALISVLWIIVGVSALALAANLAARQAVHAARNRADLNAAAWRAEACLERARAAIGESLLAARGEGPGVTVWGRMDETVAASPLLAGMDCEVNVEAAGARLDLNGADEATLRRLFLALGRTEGGADSLADALADWRDPDDVPRRSGAEAAWYAAARRSPPRDGPFADAREVLRVRGMEGVPGIDTLVSAEPGRVPLSHAPAAVLAALPGLGPEAASRAMEMRLRGDRVGDLSAFVASLSPGARDQAMRAYQELVGALAAEPEAWIVRARGAAGTPPAVRVLEVRLVRAGERAAIVRRRTWTE